VAGADSRIASLLLISLAQSRVVLWGVNEKLTERTKISLTATVIEGSSVQLLSVPEDQFGGRVLEIGSADRRENESMPAPTQK
jgi:hypothetical protein